MHAMADALGSLKRCTVVQLTGALSEAEIDNNAIELVRRMAEVARGRAYPIYAPMVLDDPAVAEALRAQSGVAQAMSWYDKVTVAVIPLGSWDPPHSGLYDSLNEQDREQLLRDGVKADTSGVLLAADGQVATPELSTRLIGITGEQLMRIPEVVLVAGGLEKVDALRAAIRANFVTSLVTNSSVAHALIND